MADKSFELSSSTEIYSESADTSVMSKVLYKITILENQISALNIQRQSMFTVATGYRMRIL